MKIGYVIANDDEEYLADIVDRGGMVGRCWSRVPDFAMRFSSRSKALRKIQKFDMGRKVYVLELHDLGSQYGVASDQEERPAWLELMQAS